MEFEELESMEKLEELMLRIGQAQTMSEDKKARLKKLNQMLMEETAPAEVDELRKKIAELEAEKAEFDEMTANAAAQAKARLDAVRAASEKKFGENLIASSNARQNATNREDQYILNEEKVIEELNAKAETMKARARERALAQAKEIASKSGGTPEQIRKMEAEEARRIIDEELAKIDEIVNNQLEKLNDRTFRNEKDTQYQELLATQASERAKLDGYRDLLEEQFPDVAPAKVKEEKPEKTPMEQYEEMEALKQQTEKQLTEKAADLKKLDEELAKHPEKAEEIKAQKAKLEAEIAVLEKGKAAAEKSMADLDKKYNLGKGKGKDDDGAGSGKGDDDGKGKGKTPVEKMQDLLKEHDRLEKAMKDKEDEINAKRAQVASEKDPDKSKVLSQELSDLTKEYDKLRIDKNSVKIQIGSLEKKMKEDEEAKKGPKPVPVYGDEYYNSVGTFGKAKLKAEAYEAATGSKPSLFRRALLMFSSEYDKKAAEMLTAGQIKPLAGDEETIKKVAEQKAAEKAAAEAAENKGKQPDPFDTLTPEQRAAAEKAAREAAAKSGGEHAPKEQPSKDGEAR